MSLSQKANKVGIQLSKVRFEGMKRIDIVGKVKAKATKFVLKYSANDKLCELLQRARKHKTRQNKNVFASRHSQLSTRTCGERWIVREDSICELWTLLDETFHRVNDFSFSLMYQRVWQSNWNEYELNELIALARRFSRLLIASKRRW